MDAILEVCAGSIESVYAAQKGGAYRVELCSGLDEGGLTPSLGFVSTAMSVSKLKKNVLIRPRGGDFLYSRAEGEVMIRDIEIMKDLGVDGVVIGALDCEGHVDLPLMKRMMRAAEGLDVTFHRAFDMCKDPSAALEKIIDLGCSRILTSGQAATAEQGISELRTMVALSAERIVVMPGCGVNAKNAAYILKMTGAREIHASARAFVDSGMVFRHEGVEMGKHGVNEYMRKETSEQMVRDIVEGLSIS